MTELVLCDDHAVFLDALGTVLSAQGFRIGAVVDRAARVVDVVRRRQPDVCLLDRHFADGDGVELIPQVGAVAARTRIVVLSGDCDPTVVNRALRLGAAGYVHKTAGIAALVTAIRRVVDGEIGVDLSHSSGARYRRDVDEANRLASYLTARERQCLGLLVEGLGVGEIARRLEISTTTVRTYVQALLTKLGVHSQLEAAAFAIRHSVVIDRNNPAAQQGAALG
ncbi:MAG TPA: response regulator transcription factor [Pseudonocardiaceae bacterium]|nr:response regulator transcription factor [Pseudonocardiaceae bacterium]